jgi:hypothetical protein
MHSDLELRMERTAYEAEQGGASNVVNWQEILNLCETFGIVMNQPL